MSKAAKLYQLSRKVHKWIGFLLSIVFMFMAITGLLLVYYLPLGLGTPLKEGKPVNAEEAVALDEAVKIATTQDLPGVDSIEDVFRVEWTPSENTYRIRLTNNQEVQIDAGTGEVLSNDPDYTGFLISLHDGYFFGNWYRYTALTMAGVSLIFLAFSGYYMIGYPLYKRLRAGKKTGFNRRKDKKAQA